MFTVPILSITRKKELPFGECGEGHIRCSYATGVEKLNIALERMSEFVDKCGK